MTVIPTAGHAQAPPVTPRGAAPQRRRRRRSRSRLLLTGAAALVVFGAVFGTIHASQVRHLHPTIPAVRAAFQPYDVVIEGDAQDGTVPVATRSSTDLQRWKDTQSPQTSADDAAISDSPTHIHLYSSKRIVLVPQGSTARVLIEKGGVRRVQILDGLYRGTTGFMSQASAVRLADLTPKMAPAQTVIR